MTTLLTHVTLFDGQGGEPLEDGALAIQDDGRIGWVGKTRELPQAIRAGAQEIDGGGQFLMPGLVDAHIHICWNGEESIFELLERDRSAILLEAVSLARRTLQQGTTSIRDVGGHEYIEMHLRAAVARGWIEGPRMKLSGRVISMTGGHGHFIAREADGPAEILKAAREQIKAGADTVKLMATGGSATPGQDVMASQLTQEELAAAVAAAHPMGRTVAAHAHGPGGIQNATLAGLDSVEHGSYLNEECAELMAERGTQLVVTLGVANPEIEDVNALTPVQRADYERRKDGIQSSRDRYIQTLQIARAHGVFLACGTDAGGNALAPHRHAMAREIELLIDYGVPPLDALTMGTKHNARVLRMEDEVGTLERGKWADLLLLRGNPLEDPRQLRAVAAVWKGGQAVDLRSGRLDD
ncbi:MAG: amidohydrolase family protein [Anaerolineaceae bacterium]|nr:amidohydrolase family protein [Anaerolineaceae bacterium]